MRELNSLTEDEIIELLTLSGVIYKNDLQDQNLLENTQENLEFCRDNFYIPKILRSKSEKHLIFYNDYEKEINVIIIKNDKNKYEKIKSLYLNCKKYNIKVGLVYRDTFGRPQKIFKVIGWFLSKGFEIEDLCLRK
jgi:hypothetical protein